jgi:hypothetical protein
MTICTAVQKRPDPIIVAPPHLADWFPNIGDDLNNQRRRLLRFVSGRDGPCWVTGCDGHNVS